LPFAVAAFEAENRNEGKFNKLKAEETLLTGVCRVYGGRRSNPPAISGGLVQCGEFCCF
jgi:hypothetical protein